LSLLLPEAYMKRVGFCLGCDSILESGLAAYRGSEERGIGVRMMISPFRNFNYDYCAMKGYIFDLRGDEPKDNYTQPLHSIGKLLQEMDMGDEMLCESLADEIRKAFDADGNLDLAQLEKIASLHLFELVGDLDSARRILQNTDNTEDVLIRSFNIVLSEDNAGGLSQQDRALIQKHYTENPAIAAGIAERYYVNLKSEYRRLSPQERAVLIAMIADDAEGGRLNEIINQIGGADYQAILDAFELTVECLRSYLTRNAFDLYGCSGLICEAVRGFTVDRFARKIPDPVKGEGLFMKLVNEQQEEICVLGAAILMASVYTQRRLGKELIEVRLRGFKNLVEKRYAKETDRLWFVVSVRMKIDELREKIEDLSINEAFDFVFSEELGKKWMKNAVSTLTMDELLTLHEMVRLGTNGGKYESMMQLLQEKLFNLDFVREKVKAGQELSRRYAEFFDLLPTSKRNEQQDIQAFLQNLKHEEAVNERFAQYRYRFSYGCYVSMSDSDKTKINQAVGTEVAEFDQMPREKRIEVVEKTVESFGVVSMVKKGRGGRLTPFALFGFGFSILSVLLLLVPAIVQVYTSGSIDQTLFWEMLAGFIPSYYAFVPVYVFLLHSITYLCLNHRNRLARANVATLLAGILPILIFVAAYVLFYLLGIKVDFSWLQ
ncbi:MAG: hypothetical protein J6K86_02255, partial [Clostridia bacterium]|nr:hypothetical protein [Clostridia bacterium]